MRTLIFWTFWIAYFALVAVGYAAEKKSCEVLLNEATLRANAVSDERVEKEKKIAELQTQLYIAQQRGIALQQQINDLKKPLEEKKAE